MQSNTAATTTMFSFCWNRWEVVKPDRSWFNIVVILDALVCGDVEFYFITQAAVSINFVHSIYINEERLKNRNTSLYNAMQFNNTTKCFLRNHHIVASTPLWNSIILHYLHLGVLNKLSTECTSRYCFAVNFATHKAEPFSVGFRSRHGCEEHRIVHRHFFSLFTHFKQLDTTRQTTSCIERAERLFIKNPKQVSAIIHSLDWNGGIDWLSVEFNNASNRVSANQTEERTFFVSFSLAGMVGGPQRSIPWNHPKIIPTAPPWVKVHCGDCVTLVVYYSIIKRFFHNVWPCSRWCQACHWLRS